MQYEVQSVDLTADITRETGITAKIEAAQPLAITFGKLAEIDARQAIIYVESGKKEVQTAVADGIADIETAAANMANKDLSNLSATGEAKFAAKQNVINDLSTIRSGAAAGATAVQPAALSAYVLCADLAAVATSGAYADLSGTPNMANYVTLAGVQTITGAKTFSSTVITGAGEGVKFNGTNHYYTMRSAGNPYEGVGLFLDNDANKPAFSAYTDKIVIGSGSIPAYANTPTDTTTTSGTQMATTGWVNSTGNNVVHLTDSETISGDKTFTGSKVFVGGYGNVIIKNTTNSDSDYCDIEFDKANWTRIGNIRVFNNGQATIGNIVSISLPPSYPRSDNSYNLGNSSQRWKQLYAGTTTISTSDERAKQGIESVPDAVLDAWGEVEFYRYKFNDAVEEKGFDKARYHTGMVAQRIRDAFAEHGLNAADYGLLCYDEWEAKAAEVYGNGEIITSAVEAGNRYSLRYEECLCMEAAYQRRRADRIEARLAALEARV